MIAFDHRVAPDPGVIEVNIHPAESWRDCVATTEALYEEARQARLGADKFLIDGKHSERAAAITSWWAGRRRSTARSSGAPTS